MKIEKNIHNTIIKSVCHDKTLKRVWLRIMFARLKKNFVRRKSRKKSQSSTRKMKQNKRNWSMLFYQGREWESPDAGQITAIALGHNKGVRKTEIETVGTPRPFLFFEQNFHKNEPIFCLLKPFSVKTLKRKIGVKKVWIVIFLRKSIFWLALFSSDLFFFAHLFNFQNGSSMTGLSEFNCFFYFDWRWQES